MWSWSGTLLAYSLFLATIGAWGLSQATWQTRSPRWGILAWQGLTASMILSAVVAGAIMSSPILAIRAGVWTVVALIDGEPLALSTNSAVCMTLTLAASALGTRFIFCLISTMRGNRRARNAHLDSLALVGDPHPDPGTIVVQHPGAVAYCLPGRRPVVVLTSGALEALSESELLAVLAHERAHLRGRHDLVLALALALRRTLWFVPALRWAHEDQAILLEMLADDTATENRDERTLASAMLNMASHTHLSPGAALAAANVACAERVRRMMRPSRPINRSAKFAISLAVLLAAAPPAAAVASAPLWFMAAPCPVASMES